MKTGKISSNMKTIAFQRPLILVLTLSLLWLAGAGCKSREAKMARFRERADKYFQDGEYNKAELEYINLLRLANKEIPEVIRNLGIMYEAQGKITKAYAFLAKAKELTPDDLETRVKLAQVYLANREFTNAFNEVDYVLQKQPTQPEALRIVARHDLQHQHLELVKQRLEALRPQAENTAAFQSRARQTLLQNARLHPSRRCLSTSVEIGPQIRRRPLGRGQRVSVANQPSQGG